MAVIGIDIGTTSICALRMEQGQVQEVKKQSHGFLDARLYTQDPEEILATVRRLTEALWSSQVTDIAISAQMHGILFTDARGRAVTPFYTWKNRKHRAVCQRNRPAAGVCPGRRHGVLRQ